MTIGLANIGAAIVIHAAAFWGVCCQSGAFERPPGPATVTEISLGSTNPIANQHSFGAKGQPLSSASSGASTARSHDPLPASGLPGSAVSRKHGVVSSVFQVSDDPNDRVWLAVTNQAVTVWGSVATRDLAERLVRRLGQIPDIREVRNRLTLRSRNDDVEIATRLREALSDDPTTDSWTIAVTVYRGVVFLSGTVGSEEERARAVDLAQNLNGVRQVGNGLQVRVANRFLSRTAGPVRIPPRSYVRH